VSQEKQETSQQTAESARAEKLSELEILQQSLEEKRRLADSYYDQLLRLRAEFDNYRRRTEKEKHTYLTWGKQEVLLKQIHLMDTLDHALASVQTSDNMASIKEGLALIVKEFETMLKGEGISEIKSDGELFDPALHEAIEYVESDRADGSVLAVLQKGYALNDKVLRPAKVKVAKNSSPESTGTSTGG
jgi:molecular chaperone GrpE